MNLQRSRKRVLKIMGNAFTQEALWDVVAFVAPRVIGALIVIWIVNQMYSL